MWDASFSFPEFVLFLRFCFSLCGLFPCSIPSRGMSGVLSNWTFRIWPLGPRRERINAHPAILRVARCWHGGLFVPVAQLLDEIAWHRIELGRRIDTVNQGCIETEDFPFNL